MIFDMPSCGGCRTCELACSYKQKGEFIPALSSIKILDKQEGIGFLVSLIEESCGEKTACDGCRELGVPMCMQYCRESEALEKILKEFAEKKETERRSFQLHPAKTGEV